MTGFTSKKNMANDKLSGFNLDEIIFQAGYKNGIFCDGVPDSWDEEAIRGFTQDIAKVCAEICENLQYSDLGPSTEVKYQRNLCGLAIRETFGVPRK
jgi:hypothetical protein